MLGKLEAQGFDDARVLGLHDSFVGLGRDEEVEAFFLGNGGRTNFDGELWDNFGSSLFDGLKNMYDLLEWCFQRWVEFLQVVQKTQVGVENLGELRDVAALCGESVRHEVFELSEGLALLANPALWRVVQN